MAVLSIDPLSVYKSSIIATIITMRDTANIWHPEPMREENISG
jgi:hypothetical protein